MNGGEKCSANKNAASERDVNLHKSMSLDYIAQGEESFSDRDIIERFVSSVVLLKLNGGASVMMFKWS